MAKFRMNASPAHRSPSGGVMIVLSLLIKSDIFPRREVEAKTTADAMAAFDAYCKEAEALNKSMVCFIDVVKGERSPNGFKKEKHQRFLNLRTEAEERALTEERAREKQSDADKPSGWEMPEYFPVNP